jgi:hypothetical protein
LPFATISKPDITWLLGINESNFTGSENYFLEMSYVGKKLCFYRLWNQSVQKPLKFSLLNHPYLFAFQNSFFACPKRVVFGQVKILDIEIICIIVTIKNGF